MKREASLQKWNEMTRLNLSESTKIAATKVMKAWRSVVKRVASTHKFCAMLAQVNKQVTCGRAWKRLEEGVKRAVDRRAAWSKCVERKELISVKQAWMAWRTALHIHEKMKVLLDPFQVWKAYVVVRRKIVQEEATSKWSLGVSCNVNDSEYRLNSLRMTTASVMVEYLEREISFAYGSRARDDRFNSGVWRRDVLIGRTVQVALKLPCRDLERLEDQHIDSDASIAARLTEVAK
jgi:hypothetical protein